MYKIYFPLFDHIESASNEMRLTHEGLVADPQVSWSIGRSSPTT